jgi:hypothetical protein
VRPWDRVHLREGTGYAQGEILEALILAKNPLPFRTFLNIVLNTSEISGIFNPFTHNCYAYADAIIRAVQEYTGVTPIIFGNSSPSLNMHPMIVGGRGICFGILMMEPLSIDVIRQSIIQPLHAPRISGDPGGLW